jgi:hypothetical protein
MSDSTKFGTNLDPIFEAAAKARQFESDARRAFDRDPLFVSDKQWADYCEHRRDDAEALIVSYFAALRAFWELTDSLLPHRAERSGTRFQREISQLFEPAYSRYCDAAERLFLEQDEKHLVLRHMLASGTADEQAVFATAHLNAVAPADRPGVQEAEEISGSIKKWIAESAKKIGGVTGKVLGPTIETIGHLINEILKLAKGLG